MHEARTRTEPIRVLSGEGGGATASQQWLNIDQKLLRERCKTFNQTFCSLFIQDAPHTPITTTTNTHCSCFLNSDSTSCRLTALSEDVRHLQTSSDHLAASCWSESDKVFGRNSLFDTSQSCEGLLLRGAFRWAGGVKGVEPAAKSLTGSVALALLLQSSAVATELHTHNSFLKRRLATYVRVRVHQSAHVSAFVRFTANGALILKAPISAKWLYFFTLNKFSWLMLGREEKKTKRNKLHLLLLLLLIKQLQEGRGAGGGN